jgi:hypothetical protein
VSLIKIMAKDNRTWGAERIHGELLKLGIKVAKSTIQAYINQVRSPVPTKQTWATFLRNHAKDIWAVDVLQTYDLFFRAIFVFVVIELGSRRLLHFGVTRSPNDAWVAQQLREATPFGEGPRFLIRDNDNKFGDAFDRVAEGTGIDVLTTPYQAPKANAIKEQPCDSPGHYEIRLRGTLPQYWSGWFGGMAITHDGEGNTLLTGPIVDQAALHGLLDKARDLGLALLEVRRVPRVGEG